MSESAQGGPAGQGLPAMAKPASGQRTARGPVMIGAAGLLFTLLAAGFVLMNSSIGIKTGDPAQPSLTFVDKNDLSAAASTLTPSTAGALIEDAQRCRIPLVSMTIQKGTAPIGSTIRIRSGSYLSPYFTITEAMQRIAVPYPAPYGSGAGTFVIEGTAQGAIIGLTPTKVMVDLPGMQTIPVVWRAVSPC